MLCVKSVNSLCVVSVLFYSVNSFSSQPISKVIRDAPRPVTVPKHTMHESKEQQRCSATRRNKACSSAYTLRFVPGHLQVIQQPHKQAYGKWYEVARASARTPMQTQLQCGYVKSSLSRTDPGLDSLSLTDHSNGRIAAMERPPTACPRDSNHAFLSYCRELLPRRPTHR